jgi:hypothetical protein
MSGAITLLPVHTFVAWTSDDLPSPAGGSPAPNDELERSPATSTPLHTATDYQSVRCHTISFQDIVVSAVIRK